MEHKRFHYKSMDDLKQELTRIEDELKQKMMEIRS